jgi:putative endopeptidase
MQKQLLVISVLVFLTVIFSCKENQSSSESPPKFIETANFDSSVKPGDNFFLYVNGKWVKAAKVPPTEFFLGSVLDVINRTKLRLKTILDSVSKGGQAPGSIEQKVGDLYASGMDSDAIEKLGDQPLQSALHHIDSITDVKSLLYFEADRQKEYHSYILSFYIGADQKNSGMNIVNFGQTGLGLPDRDYYFKSDSASIALQKAYQQYIKKIFVLTGDDSVKASHKCATVYALEKQIAGSHRNNVQLRDPQSNYNKVTVASLDKKMPMITWSNFLNNVGAKTDSLNLAQPGYYLKLNELLRTVPIETWKAYYQFHVTDDAAPALSTAFVNARFEYASKALYGQQQIKPRWERMYATVDNNMGEALGRLYVQKYFSEDAKKRMLELVNNLQTAFENRIDRLDWMSDSTKSKAKDKLHAFLKKIGYTDKWRDYSAVVIGRNTYFDNIISCSKNEYRYQIGKLGKPVDRTEWSMTPPTIDAYYNPTFNEIVFPAGILQIPFFDPEADDAMNYGGIGMIIGHEMTHGFDDQGAQFDKSGNLKNWWAKKDSIQFVAKSKMVINQYNHFTVLDSIHVNGALTTGENMADIGGVAIAYDAFKMTKQGQDSTKIDGFTPDQRFFISLAQIYRSKMNDNYVRTMINTDPHSPFMYRVNGPLMNSSAFYAAFNVQPGDKMYLPDSSRIKIW